MSTLLLTENSNQPGRYWFAARLVFVALAYFVCAKLGLAYPYEGTHITLIWLPTGVAVAALWRFGYQSWPGIFLGSFAANFFIDFSPLLDISIAVGNTLAPLFAVWILRSYKFRSELDRAYDTLLLGAAAAIGMLVSASGGVISLLMFNMINKHDAGAAWLSWWGGDFLGVLLAAPLLLNITAVELKKFTGQRLEFLAWCLIMFVVSWGVFFLNNDAHGNSQPMVFLLLPLTVWSAMRFRIMYSSLGVLLPALVAAAATSLGLGPFNNENAHHGLFLLWLFLVTLVFVALMVEALQAGRKRAERKTEGLVRRHQALMNSALEGVHVIDKLGNILEANNAFCRMLGYTHEEVAKLNVSDWDNQWSRAELLERIGDLIQLDRALFETRHLRKDGSIIDVEIFSTGTEMDGQKCLYAVSRDISGRKQAEEKLRIAAVTFETQEAILITDADAQILTVNQAFQEITGYRADEVIGKNPRMLQSGRHDVDFYREMWAALNGTGKWSGEVWDKRKNGEIYPKTMTITAVHDGQQKVTHFVAVFRDITERQQALEKLQNTAIELERANIQIEEERAQLTARVEERTSQLQYANHAKDSFLATMSHEIRTPLGGLLGMMELLNLSQLDHKQVEMLQIARSSGRSLLRIVDDILDWSKIEAGKLELAPHVSSIGEMIKGVTNTYAQVASAKGILLHHRIDASLSAAHVFDPLRISQILNNFASNAIKFTERGSVEIRAERVGTTHNGSEEVRFSVKDSGIGIDPAQGARLFQQYEQVSNDTARMYGGTGLGLSICRNLAELMEGNIRMESAPGAGSTFYFTVRLPLANMEAQLNLQQSIDKKIKREDGPRINSLGTEGQHLSVLVVDDHPVNRMLLKQQLEQLGLQAEVAESGVAGLSLWQTGHFDLIITDCHMPEMDGYEFTYRIRNLEKLAGSQRVPIIAWTANVLAAEEEHCRDAGMDDLLTKPTELSDLRAMLLKWLVKADAIVVPAPSTEPTEAAIDFSVLQKFALGHAGQAEMLQSFSLHNRSDIANLIAVLKEGNPEAVAHSAHRIKGACRMVGALELEGICARIEAAAKQDDMQGAQAAAEMKLDDAVARIEAVIGGFISGTT